MVKSALQSRWWVSLEELMSSWKGVNLLERLQTTQMVDVEAFFDGTMDESSPDTWCCAVTVGIHFKMRRKYNFCMECFRS